MDDELIGIEEEFRKSWDDVESHYAEHYSIRKPHLSPLLILIAEMRGLGYDEWLYASADRDILVLSRLQNGDFKKRKKNFLFMVIEDNGSFGVGASIAGKWLRLDCHPPVMTTALKALLDLLIAQPIE